MGRGKPSRRAEWGRVPHYSLRSAPCRAAEAGLLSRPSGAPATLSEGRTWGRQAGARQRFWARTSPAEELGQVFHHHHHLLPLPSAAPGLSLRLQVPRERRSSGQHLRGMLENCFPESISGEGALTASYPWGSS